MVGFWIRYAAIIISFIPMSILSIVLFPVSYLFRYKIKKDWFKLLLNDTVDGDFGADWWLEENNLTKSFWSAWRWTCRNSAWNYKISIKPKWNGGKTDWFKTVKNTLVGKWTWADRDKGYYGFNHCYYIIENIMYGRLSYATEYFELQLGAAGNRYKFRIKIDIIKKIKSLFKSPKQK